MKDYYSQDISEIVKSLKSTQLGLASNEAEKRISQFGFNELQKEKKLIAITIFLNQFKNSLSLLLIFAGFLSLILGETIESVAMFTIVFLNAVLGFFQEYKAEKALESLEKMSAPIARVLRDSQEKKIPAKEIVPGDIILLEAGDIVPADSRLLSVSSLFIDEASLTGESIPSEKTSKHFEFAASVADQENMAFMGTVVTYGKGKGIVTNTGMKTEFGKIAKSLQTTKGVKTPLQIKFEQLARQIGFIAVILIIIILISGSLKGTVPFNKMLLISLTLAVATIPIALPTIVTVSLALGSKRLAKKNMLIKKLHAAESLGAATIIVSDKTGTITKNQMTVTDIFFNGEIIKVSGSGYKPEGSFFVANKQINPKNLGVLLRIGCLCNNSKLTKADGKYGIIGDPTEGSLIVLAKKGEIERENIQNHYSFVEELPFDSDRKIMSIIIENKVNKKTEAYVKGAPDILLTVCDRILENGRERNLTKKDRDKILEVNHVFSQNALRVLALAHKEVPNSKKYSIDNVENNLVFVGLVGMIDPPRDDVKSAVKQCREAGIKVMVVTGDHPTTAQAVAQQIGLFEKGDLILTGDDLTKMGNKELGRKIEKIKIIARALPIQKLRIVEVLQKKGHIVAMTGDGVNDAPALKKADIGIAMGITGTDVAKEVSKAILTDDNFATIVNAIDEGRNIFDKMIKSARYLLSCNVGEITTVLIAIMLNFPIPLIPLQILLINLLTDAFPAMGLGFEPSEEGVMKRAPRAPKEKPITLKILITILVFGMIMAVGTIFMFVQYLDSGLVKAQTIAFTTLVMFQLFAVMSSRSLSSPFTKLNPLHNKWLLGAVLLSVSMHLVVVYWPPLQTIFGTVPLSGSDWIKILGISSLGFIIMEISKLFMEKKGEYLAAFDKKVVSN